MSVAAFQVCISLILKIRGPISFVIFFPLSISCNLLYLVNHHKSCAFYIDSRRRNKQENSEAGSRPTQSKKFRGRDFSYGDGQNGRRVDRVYPSEKLKFKN